MAFLDNLTPAAAVCMALALLCAVLLAVLLAIVLRGRRATSEALSAVEETLRHELQATEGALGQQSDQRREELLRAIGQLGENLSGTFSAMSRSQAEQVNALVRQSYDNAQAFDLRQQGMQRIADESLKRIEARMQGSEAALARALSQNETRMEALRTTLEEGARRMREENAQKLTEMRQTVDEKLSATLEKRLTASFSQVSERLEQVYRSLGEVHSLASGVGDLKRMLGNVKTRGVWGEIQLGALLEEALTDTQYQRNVAVSPGSSERVEFAVCLPGREEGGAPVYLPIDSKFPQEDYARLAEAAQNGDQPAVEAARKALMTAVRTEAHRQVHCPAAHHGFCGDVFAAGRALCGGDAACIRSGGHPARAAGAHRGPQHAAGFAQQPANGLSHAGHRAALRRGVEAAGGCQGRFWQLCHGAEKDAGKIAAGHRQH